MLEDVLPIGGAVAEAAKQSDELGVHIGDAELHKCVLTGADTQLVHLGLGPLMGLFDPLRVNAAVEHQTFKCDSSDLTTNRIEARQQYRLGRVIDDQVDAGHGLERTDIAAFSADDPPLHVVAWQVEYGDHGLGGLFGREALNREGDDAPGALVSLFTSLGFDISDDDRRVAFCLILDGRDDLRLRLIGREPGGPLKDESPILLDVEKLGTLLRDLILLEVKLASPLLHQRLVGMRPLLALREPVLAPLQIQAQLAHIFLEMPGLFVGLPLGLLRLLSDHLGLRADIRGLGLGSLPDITGLTAGFVELNLGDCGHLLLAMGSGVVPATHDTGDDEVSDNENRDEYGGEEANYQQSQHAAHGTHSSRRVPRRTRHDRPGSRRTLTRDSFSARSLTVCGRR